LESSRFNTSNDYLEVATGSIGLWSSVQFEWGPCFQLGQGRLPVYQILLPGSGHGDRYDDGANGGGVNDRYIGMMAKE
jgi:hypothetical protein